MDLNFFDSERVPRQLLRERAYNFRWAAVPEDVVPLTAADPDFAVAPEISAAIIDYAKGGVFSYGPKEGLPEFRAAAAQIYTERKQVATTPDLILPVNSAAAGMYLIARWALQPGDEVIIFDPVDFLFRSTVEAVGGVPIRISVNPQTGYIDREHMEASINSRTRMIGLCNPLNPTGKVFSEEELLWLGELAIRHNLWIMSDEIWSDMVYAPYKHTSIAALSPEIARRTLTIYGFSKTFGLAGLRIGFVIAPTQAVWQELFACSLMPYTIDGVSTVSQVAAVAAMQQAWYWAADFLAHLSRLRRYAVERLNQMPYLSCHLPEGCYVLMPRIADSYSDSNALCERFLQEGRVAVVPGEPQWFGVGAAGHFRICYATSEDILREGLDRIERVMERLP